MKVGRNDPCPCGSGAKYKKCCMARDARQAEAVRNTLAQRRDTGWATSVPDGHKAPTPEEVASWPVRQAWVPVPEILAVTGNGGAGVLRERAPGEWVHAFFLLRLAEGGLYGMTNSPHTDPAKTAALAAELTGHMAPNEPGDPARAARLLWACHDHALEVDEPPPPQSLTSLALLPRVSDARGTLEDIAGPGQSVPRALVELVRAHPRTDLSEGQEIAVHTEARFALADPAAAAVALRAMAPDLDPRTETAFDFTRPSRPAHTAPMSRLPGRRIQGEVVLEGDELVARAGLSMMTRLLIVLRAGLPQRPALRAARWDSPTLRRRWEWDVAREPLALA